MAQQHDIEDVLTSIRRLVANESGATAHIAKTPAPTEGPTLVLSDTHRVTEPEDPFQMIRSLAQAEVDGRDAEHLTDSLPDDMAAITSDLSEGLKVDLEEKDAAEDTLSDMPAFLVVHASDDYAEDADFEAEEPADDTPAGDTPEAAPTAKTGASPAPSSAPDDTTETAGSADLAALSRALGADDGDEALRDLITEIVRQELAGELGERITRNVRKLVRREIRQMMASEEFE